MQTTKRFIVWTVVGALILTLLVGMQFTTEVQWNEATAYTVILLAAGGSFELWKWLQTRSREYRIACGVGLAGLFLLGWVSGAVGIIGSENNPANLLYWTVPAVGLVGCLLAGFKPRGLARALFAVAITQLLVPAFALVVWPAQGSWGEAGVIGVFIVNAFFAALFAGSGLLFARAAKQQ